MENVSYANNTIGLLARSVKANVVPYWRSESREVEIERDIRNCIRGALGSWIELPEIQEVDFNSNKYLPYPVTNI